ncbi:hypothetical protein BC351_10550 [Paenibacillus ferrarius]|uniref:Uncharacterized protein n=2 Tax=Paenibacillus ferrarius TaxID=1469647 RepID=A0A1V4H9B3_9BACL|nr:hypothetical protein BC351_10550 [Paenibacillus ferrarius]
MTRLIESEELVKAVGYNESNFLEQPIITDPSSLIYENIYPYRFVPDLNTHQKTFITLSFRGYKPVDGYYKSGLVYFNVITHKDLIKTDYGALRYDFIIQKIDELMNNTRGLGIGNTQFHSMDELYIDEKYMGMFIAYKLLDFS